LESHQKYEPVDHDLEDEWEDSDTESNKSLEELEGDELEHNLQSLREEVERLSVPTPYAEITKKKMAREWVDAESNHSLGYNGHAQKARAREEEQKKS